MIEPFKEQLESFELEKKALLSQSEQAQGEVKKLAIQYGSLLGKPWTKKAVLRIRIHMFLGHPDPLVRGMDPDPALDPDPAPSIIMQK